MNDRKAIVSNQKINLKDLSNNNCYIEFTIEKEIGRGASCIVYEASYEQNGFTRHCRLKEFFPIDTEDKKYDVLRENNVLIVQEHSKELFDDAKNHFLEGIKKQISFYESISDARNQTSYIGGIYSAGDSVYCTMLCDEGTSYDKIHEERLIDILKTAKAIAVAVSKYHNYTVDGVKKPILHLDLKPSNIFILADTREIVKLFDYDSVIFKEDLNNANIKLSGSTGYMPHELENAKTDWISEKTDIYSIGAIVFERIMGRCVNNSTDKRAKNIDIQYNNPLFENLSVTIYEKLSKLFKKTCCCGIVDRFNNIEELIIALDELIEYAKPIEYSLKKFLPSVTSSFLGRENELNDVDQELQNSNYVILSGMGGIGKTEIAITYANIAEQNKKYDCFFINYQENLHSTIINMEFDNIEQYYIKNNIDKNNKEKVFDAKIDLLSKLGNTTLLVIDNMDMNSENVSAAVNEPAFIKLVSCGVKIIFTSRNSFAEHCLPIGTLHEEELLKMIDHDETNIESVKKLIEIVDYHTLVVDLIGKTIRESWGEITPQTMLERLEISDFDNEGFDEVISSKDGYEVSATLYGHIKKLFTMSNLSKKETMCLNDLSLFKSGSIKIEELVFWGENANKAIIKQLSRKGWISIDQNIPTINIHPIIKAYVNNESGKRYSKLVEEVNAKLEKTYFTEENEIRQELENVQHMRQECICDSQLLNVYIALAKKSLCYGMFNLKDKVKANTLLPLPYIYSFEFLSEKLYIPYWVELYIVPQIEALISTSHTIDNDNLDEAYVILSYLTMGDILKVKWDNLSNNQYIKELLHNKRYNRKEELLFVKKYICLADVCVTDNNFKLALKNYKKAMCHLSHRESNANDYLAYVNLQLSKLYYSKYSPRSDSDIRHKRTTLNNSIKYIKKSLRYQKDNGYMRIYTGYILLNLLLESKKWAEAIAFINQELTVLSDKRENISTLEYSLFCLQTLCTIYQMQRRFKDALNIKLKYISLNQDSCHYRQKSYYKHDNSLKDTYSNSLDDECKDYDELGKIYEHIEEYENAINSYKKSISFYDKKIQKKYYLDEKGNLDMCYFPQCIYPENNLVYELRLKRVYTVKTKTASSYLVLTQPYQCIDYKKYAYMETSKIQCKKGYLVCSEVVVKDCGNNTVKKYNWSGGKTKNIRLKRNKAYEILIQPKIEKTYAKNFGKSYYHHEIMDEIMWSVEICDKNGEYSVVKER